VILAFLLLPFPGSNAHCISLMSSMMQRAIPLWLGNQVLCCDVWQLDAFILIMVYMLRAARSAVTDFLFAEKLCSTSVFPCESVRPVCITWINVLYFSSPWVFFMARPWTRSSRSADMLSLLYEFYHHWQIPGVWYSSDMYSFHSSSRVDNSAARSIVDKFLLYFDWLIWHARFLYQWMKTGQIFQQLAVHWKTTKKLFCYFYIEKYRNLF
jgi:hypothetical protein